MANAAIKRTAITFTGYMYQNLVGLNLLCDWLDDPSLFEWVKFESDDEEGAPQGLDDVVAQRSDGSLLLMQVKFTVDAKSEDNRLSWDWLVQRRKKGSSLLKKWAVAYSEATSKGAVDATLVTNRRPDREFEACLDGSCNLKELELVPKRIRVALDEEGVAAPTLDSFLRAFRFIHSKEDDVSLDRVTQDRAIPRHTSMHGWLNLRYLAIQWATRKGLPPPNGRISLAYLREVLSQTRPKPLDQDFRIPASYQVPDEAFLGTLIARITQQNTPTVLWGTPGQGKSTFLSYVCAELNKSNIPYLRHHYFLSLGDVEDRFSYASVANSLMAQIEARYPDCVPGLAPNPESLRDWIASCAQSYAQQGKQFVIVIDGLDHVWRETRNKQPLDSLFSKLLPLPPNAALVVGTQRVESAQLPKSFAHHIEASDWTELPRMGVAPIARWLRCQLDEGRLEIPNHDDEEHSLGVLATAFHEVTGGHPLILTYTFLQVTAENRYIDERVIGNHVIRSEGDIHKYYSTLWDGLSYPARDALHLIADAGFFWPGNGLEECMGIRGGSLHKEIGHLVYLTEAGLVPFHGSVLVFAMGQSDHLSTIKRLLPEVIAWLSSAAPRFHRWGWLWIYEARAGDTGNILNETSRDWAVGSLADGYPVDQSVAVLEVAERLAFEAEDFARAVSIRWLKQDLANGPEFQIDDYRRIERLAHELGDDDYPSKVLAANAHSADEYTLFLLGSYASARGNADEARNYLEKLRQKINDKIEARAYRNEGFTKAIRQLFDLYARTGAYDPLRLSRNISSLGESRSALVLAEFCAQLRKLGALRRLVDLHKDGNWTSAHAGIIEQEIIRCAADEEAKIELWPEYGSFQHSFLASCWSPLYANHCVAWRVPVRLADLSSLDYEEQIRQLDGHVYDAFFDALACDLNGVPATTLAGLDEKHAWLVGARRELISAAGKIATTLKRGESIPFSRIFRLTAAVVPPKGMDAHREMSAFRRAVLAIAADLFALSKRRSKVSGVTGDDWKQAKEHAPYLLEQWISGGTSRVALRLLGPVAKAEIAELRRTISNERTPFNDRVEKFVSMCELALDAELRDEAKELLIEAVRCVVGYGWRKNIKLDDVMSSIKELGTIMPAEARAQLERMASVATHISDMTEDDAFRAHELTPIVMGVMPDRLAALYRYWIEEAEWYHATEALSYVQKELDLVAPVSRLIARTTWDSVGLAGIKANVTSSSEEISFALHQCEEIFGFTPGNLPASRDSTSSSNASTAKVLDGAAYGADDLEKLLRDLGGDRFLMDETVLAAWFSAASESGKGIDALRCLEKHLDADVWMSPVATLFDEAFEESLRLEGPKAAFKWLVGAHNSRSGWEPFYDRRAKQRLRKVAENYPSRWREFVRRTASTSAGVSRGLAIPGKRLVDLLVALGEGKVAASVVEAMANAVLESFGKQPLPRPSWLDEDLEHA